MKNNILELSQMILFNKNYLLISCLMNHIKNLHRKMLNDNLLIELEICVIEK